MGDLVQLNQWATVELVKYTSDSYWVARVNSQDVAHIKINANRIYKGFASMEEAYNEPIDPEMTGKFWFADPQYNYGGWKNWTQSATSPDQHNFIALKRQVNFANDDPNSQCPTYYGATTNLLSNDIWYWYAGTGGGQCGHIFPPIAYDNGNAAFTYTNNWTFSSCCANAWKGTLNWSNITNEKATLTTIANYHPTNSITRLYTMAPNRGNSLIKKNGTTVASSNDYASTKRYQVARTWSASGATTMEVINNCCNYIDVDAFLVDVPQVANGTYDNYHYMLRYIGTWTHNSTGVPSATNGTLSWTNNAEDAVSFTFTGSQINYVYTQAPNRGKAAVTIDGVEKEVVNACNATKVWQRVKTYTGLGSGTHTIHIANMGQSTCGDGSSTYQYIDVDQFNVYP